MKTLLISWVFSHSSFLLFFKFFRQIEMVGIKIVNPDFTNFLNRSDSFLQIFSSVFFCQIAMVELKTVHSGFTIFSKNLSFPWKCFPVFFRQIEMVEVKIVHSGFTNFSKKIWFLLENVFSGVLPSNRNGWGWTCNFWIREFFKKSDSILKTFSSFFRQITMQDTKRSYETISRVFFKKFEAFDSATSVFDWEVLLIERVSF